MFVSIGEQQKKTKKTQKKQTEPMLFSVLEYGMAEFPQNVRIFSFILREAVCFTSRESLLKRNTI